MIEMTDEVRRWVDEASNQNILESGEYIDPDDGLIHCGVCHERRQTVVKRFRHPGYFIPRCPCSCQIKEERQRKEQQAQRERMERIKRRRAHGLRDKSLYAYTFDHDNGSNPVMEKARAYVRNWKEALRNNIGLLLFGDVGTGKSFFAGCIANALLDQDVPVLMTSFPTILNQLTGVYPEERVEFINSLNDYDLLIIDDLGVERSTEFAMEQVFEVIDRRYRCGKPMIITTNLTLEQLRNPPDLAHARIYERILERCAPILFSGENFRKQKSEENKRIARMIVSSGA